jgi:hypothetical protein
MYCLGQNEEKKNLFVSLSREIPYKNAKFSFTWSVKVT